MQRSLLTLYIIFTALATMAAVTLLASVSGAETFNGDTQLWGTHENKTVDIWGNVTVPADSTLTLRNVTMVFRTDLGGVYGLRMEKGASLLVHDGDDDPSTPGDASVIKSSGETWYIMAIDAARLEIRASRIENLGRRHEETGRGWVEGVWITCDAVELWESEILCVDCLGEVTSPTVDIKGSTFSDIWVTVDVMDQPVSMVDVFLENTILILRNGLSFTFERSSLVDSRLVSYVFSNITVRGTLFDASSLTTHSDFQVDIIECVFQNQFQENSLSIDARPDRVRVYDCHFEKSNSGIFAPKSNLTMVADCTFENVNYPITVAKGDADIRDVTISGAALGVMVQRFGGAVNVLNMTCRDSLIGIQIEEWTGPIDLYNCSFTNIDDKGINIVRPEKETNLRLMSCSFVNILYGISGDPLPSYGWELEVIDSSFEQFLYGLKLFGAKITVIGNTFDPGHDPYDIRYCIYIRPMFWTNHSVLLIDNILTGAGTGIDIDTYGSGSTASVTRNTFNGFDQGLVAINLTQAIFNGNVFESCHKSITVSNLVYLSVDNVTIANGTDGISIDSSDQVRLGHLEMRNLTGIALRETDTLESFWTVTENQVLDGLRIIIGGEILVNGTLHLVDTDMTFKVRWLGIDGVNVFEGGSLLLQSSSLSSVDNIPFIFTVTDGGTLTVVDSTIVDCGGLIFDNSQSGPYLEGEGHRLEGLTSVDCYNGLVLVNATVEMVDCVIRGNAIGIESIGSNVTVTDSAVFGRDMGISADGSVLIMDRCTVNSSSIALFARLSVLSLTNSTVQASSMSIQAESAVLEFFGSTIATEDELVRLYRSELTTRSCVISPNEATGGQLITSQVRMYDTSHYGPWSPRGDESRVEQYWYHQIKVLNRWDGAEVEGVWVDIYDLSLEDPYVARAQTSIDGLTDAMWLLEREVDSAREVIHGPYWFQVTGDAIYGEIEAPGRERWVGTIQLIDILPPDLTILEPGNRTFHNVTGLDVSGTIYDDGSGIDRVEMSIDGEPWTLVATEEGMWNVSIQVLEGIHFVSFRAIDMDGCQTLVEIVPTVDTVLPLVVITQPWNGTIFRWASVQVTGFVVIDNGTPIKECRIAGMVVTLNETGHFSIDIQMPTQGTNAIMVVATDDAGNRGETVLVLGMDWTPPELLVDDLPDTTREQELTVSGSVLDPLVVSVYINGDLVTMVRNGNFETTIFLSLGLNELTIEAVDAVGNNISVLRTVVLDTMVSGMVTFPVNGAAIEKTYVMVSIETDPFTWVRVRNRTEWILAPGNGSMGIWVTLVEGENQLIVDFRDEANNTHMVGVDVIVTLKEPEGAGVSLLLWIGLAIIAGVAIVLILNNKYRWAFKPKEEVPDPNLEEDR